MLKISFEAESGCDMLSPISVANALISLDTAYSDGIFNKSELRQIAEHLLIYCNHNSEGKT